MLEWTWKTSRGNHISERDTDKKYSPSRKHVTGPSGKSYISIRLSIIFIEIIILFERLKRPMLPGTNGPINIKQAWAGRWPRPRSGSFCIAPCGTRQIIVIFWGALQWHDVITWWASTVNLMMHWDQMQTAEKLAPDFFTVTGITVWTVN